MKSSGADEVLEGVMVVKIHHEQGVFPRHLTNQIPWRVGSLTEFARSLYDEID